MNKPTETQLTAAQQQLAIAKAESDIRNAINLLSEEIPSLEFGPHGKAFDLVFDACRLLEEASEEAGRSARLEYYQEMGWVE